MEGDIDRAFRGVDSMSDDYPDEVKPWFELMKKLMDENIDGKISGMSDGFERVGVFGPYMGDGKVILPDICKYVASKGFVVLTDFSYYHPSNPSQAISLTTIFSPEITKLLNAMINRKYFYKRYLPSFVNKAIAKLNPQLRTQMTELEGCEFYHMPEKDKPKPVLGFINHRNVRIRRNKCDWVDVSATNPLVLHDVINHWKSCPIDAHRPVDCIFYNPCNIPQQYKTMFISKRPFWEFYSLKDIGSLYPLIDEFLAKDFSSLLKGPGTA
jgi:hypothetical protein